MKQTYESCIDFTVAYEDFNVNSETETGSDADQRIMKENLD